MKNVLAAASSDESDLENKQFLNASIYDSDEAEDMQDIQDEEIGELEKGYEEEEIIDDGEMCDDHAADIDEDIQESLKLHFSHPGVLLRDGLQPISAHGSPSLLRDGLHSAHFGCPSLLRDGLHSAHLDSPSLLRDGLQPISALLHCCEMGSIRLISTLLHCCVMRFSPSRLSFTAARWAPFSPSRLSFTAA
ncbi:hypothetical protein EMCRGX_G019627 [Ephydatia muelleri]|eukprot:Em0011g413a